MSWHCKNSGAYFRTSTEALENAQAAYSVLSARGFSLLAFCGVWGNVESESGYNPWRWQSDVLLPVGDPRIYYQNGHAYGLCQWDAASKYIDGGVSYSGYGPNFQNQAGLLTDGNAQLAFLDDTAVLSGQYYPNPNYSYQISYDDFKNMTLGTYTIEYAVRAWFYNYERGTWDYGRVNAAAYWYATLSGYNPHNIPIWLLFKMKEGNSRNV